VVIAATLHFEPSGASRLKRRCSLTLTAVREVNLVVTDLGMFEVMGGRFFLREYFEPYTPEWIKARTDAEIVIPNDCRPSSFE
jgi:acetate CoA/acetoacetate CoA-transferase beta subunit